MINQYRIFYDRADGMEAWLGRMARSGKRLISVQGSAFSFENCPKGAYEYRVCFVAVSQHAVRKKQMEERGYRTFWLPIGRNAKDGRARMILEREKSSAPFSVFSDTEERRAYIRRVKRIYLGGAAALALVILFVPFGYYLAARLTVALAFLYCLGRAFGYYKKGWSLDHDGEPF